MIFLRKPVVILVKEKSFIDDKKKQHYRFMHVKDYTNSTRK